MAADSLIRLDRPEGFTVLLNGALRDPRLSLKAKGLFAVLASLPPNWEHKVSGLATVCNTGRDTVRGALREMEAAGYLTREQTHGEHGKFSVCVYVIHDVSIKPLADEEASPLTENPSTANPATGKPSSAEPSSENTALLNKDILSKDCSNIPPLPPRGKRGKQEKQLPDEVRAMLNEYVAGDPELAEAMVALMELRQANKKAVNTPRAVKMLLSELDRLSDGDGAIKVQIVRQSVLSGWAGVFPLRGGGRPAAPPGTWAADPEVI